MGSIGLMFEEDAALTSLSDSELSTRRRLLSRVGTFGAAAVALPIAQGLAAPPPASADQIPTSTQSEPAFTGGVAITDSGTAASQHWFTLGPRVTTALGFPVPTLRPIATGQGLSLDIMPNGTAPNNPANGYTWIDVCDTDVYNGVGSVGTARVGIFPDHVEFGSRGFSGSTGKPVWLSANGDGVSPPQVRLDPGSPGKVTLGPDGSSVTIPQSLSVGGGGLNSTALTVRAATSVVLETVNHSAPSSTSGAGVIGRSFASPTSSDQRLGYFLFGGDQAAANTAGMIGWSAEAWQPGSHLGTYLTFENTPARSTSRRERMRIGSDGVLRITDADAIPQSNPPQGTGYLFAQGGALMWRAPSGKTTTIAAG
jgi:hypothetical protein